MTDDLIGKTADLIGKNVRFYVDDGKGDWQELFGEGAGQPILMGRDLAAGPELVDVRLEQLREIVSTKLPLRVCQPSHPTTARELRRAERRRKR